ncbi:MAG TPA: cupin domain-containing protein [Pseudonocardiaceae bacterium]
MTGATAIPQVIARTVRSVREAHSMTVEGLAARAGIGVDEVTAIETGDELPKLANMIAVADALGIPLARLVEGEPEPFIRIFGADRQAVLWHGPKGGSGKLIAGGDSAPSLELWKWELHPGETRYGAPHLPGNWEIAAVDEGTLTLTIDGKRWTLQEGEAAVFVGDRPHSYGNEHDTVLRYTVTLADP